MILQQDRATLAFAESRHVLVLAVAHQRTEQLRAAVVLDDLHSVEPVFDMTPGGHDPRAIPLSWRQNSLGAATGLVEIGGRDQVVEGAGSTIAAHAELGIGVALVVENLELQSDRGACQTQRGAELWIDEIFDATVRAGSDAEVELELEVRELFPRDDIAAVGRLPARCGVYAQHTVSNRPAVIWEPGQSRAVPAIRRGAIPQ